MWQHLLVTIRAEIDCIMMRDALRIHVHVHVHVHCDAGPNTNARATIANTPFAAAYTSYDYKHAVYY